MKHKLPLAILFIVFSVGVNAQKIKFVSGSFAPLKGVSEVNLKFTYDNLMVGKITEDEYLAKKIKDYNEKEPGKGDKFKEGWDTDREKRYHPKFEKLINEYTGTTKFGDYPEAKYTMVVQVIRIEPGWNIGISKRAASLDCDIKILDESENEIMVATVRNAPGSQFGGYDYDVGSRVAECYAITGKRMGGFFKKQTKK